VAVVTAFLTLAKRISQGPERNKGQSLSAILRFLKGSYEWQAIFCDLRFAELADSTLREAKNALRSPVFRGEVGLPEPISSKVQRPSSNLGADASLGDQERAKPLPQDQGPIVTALLNMVESFPPSGDGLAGCPD